MIYLPNETANDSDRLTMARAWAMPNKNTFTIEPIRQFIQSFFTDGLWIDAFANENRLATITNDLDPQYSTDHHLDAFEFLQGISDETVDGVLFDPPYSP